MLTEKEKIIRHINHLNKRITFTLLPEISAAFSDINSAHKQLMDDYAKLVELSGEYSDNQK